MKKIFFLSVAASFAACLPAGTACSFAQDGDFKNFRFGGTALPALYWFKPDEKKFENRGAAFRFGVLLNGEYSFGGTFATGFGIGLGSAGGKLNFPDSTHYYVFEEEIMPSSKPDTTWEHYLLKTRTYKASYFILPVSLKMRTNEIGYMRYFFEPRFSINIRKKVRANDDVVVWGKKEPLKQEDLDITKDMAFMRMSVTLSAGGEYYLSGSTAFVFAIGYDYGLSNVAKKESDNLLRRKNNTDTPTIQKFAQNGIILGLGFLF